MGVGPKHDVFIIGSTVYGSLLYDFSETGLDEAPFQFYISECSVGKTLFSLLEKGARIAKEKSTGTDLFSAMFVLSKFNCDSVDFNCDPVYGRKLSSSKKSI